jgi:hypothetical protein
LQICRHVIALRAACHANTIVGQGDRCIILDIEARIISSRWLISQMAIVAQETKCTDRLEQIDLQVRCSAVVLVFDGR